MVSLFVVSLLLIHVGGAFADGVSEGDRSRLSPISQLGRKADLTQCTSAPLGVGNAKAAFCSDWNGVVSKDGIVQVVTLHALHDSGVVDAYGGTLPLELAWGDTITAVQDKLGEPDRITGIYGTPTFVYMFEGLPFGSLELRFTGGDRLMAINACLKH
jgi:hypothetical protein